jgi:hypothetical protein
LLFFCVKGSKIFTIIPSLRIPANGVLDLTLVRDSAQFLEKKKPTSIFLYFDSLIERKDKYLVEKSGGGLLVQELYEGRLEEEARRREEDEHHQELRKRIQLREANRLASQSR